MDKPIRSKRLPVTSGLMTGLLRQAATSTAMRLTIPKDIVRRAEATQADIRVALAVQLYCDNRLDHADACKLARLSSAQFNSELLARGITIQQYPRVGQTRREAG